MKISNNCLLRMLTLSVMILSLLPMFGAKESTMVSEEEPELIDYTLAEDIEDEVPLNLWAYVKANNVNLRETPGTNGKLVGNNLYQYFYMIKNHDLQESGGNFYSIFANAKIEV